MAVLADSKKIAIVSQKAIIIRAAISAGCWLKLLLFPSIVLVISHSSSPYYCCCRTADYLLLHFLN